MLLPCLRLTGAELNIRGQAWTEIIWIEIKLGQTYYHNIKTLGRWALALVFLVVRVWFRLRRLTRNEKFRMEKSDSLEYHEYHLQGCKAARFHTWN